MNTLEKTKQINTRIQELIPEIFKLNEELFYNSKSYKDREQLNLFILELDCLCSEIKYLKSLTSYCEK